MLYISVIHTGSVNKNTLSLLMDTQLKMGGIYNLGVGVYVRKGCTF